MKATTCVETTAIFCPFLAYPGLLLIVVMETKTLDRSIPISLQNRGCAAAQCPSVRVSGSAWPDVSRLMQIAQPALAMASSNQALCFIPTSNQFQCKLSGPGQQPPAAASETPTPPHPDLTLSISYKSSSFLLGHLSKVI